MAQAGVKPGSGPVGARADAPAAPECVVEIMQLHRTGLGLPAHDSPDSLVYDVYALVGRDGQPVRTVGTACFQPLLDSPGWGDAMAAIEPDAGRRDARPLRYVVEGNAGRADFTLTVKRLRRFHEPDPPPCVPVAPPAGNAKWAEV